MRHLKKFNESTDNTLDFYKLEEIFLSLSDVLDVDMSQIKHEDGKFIFSNNAIYINMGNLNSSSFKFEISKNSYDRFKKSLDRKRSLIDTKIEELNNIKDKINLLNNKLEEELPDILNRLNGYKHFDKLTISSNGTSIVIVVYLTIEYFREEENGANLLRKRFK